MGLRIPVAVAAAMIVAGCAATAPGRAATRAPSLTETIDAQIAGEDAIAWTLRRRLTWADFQGKAPDNAGVLGAQTAYRIIDGVRCAGSRFEYRVVAIFRAKESWVRHDLLRTPADSARALRHEQTHFDLSEVHARRLRRYFIELIAPCKMSSDDLSTASNRMEREEKAAQELYDSETDHGRNLTQQARWDKEVDTQLVALGRFVR